MTTANLCIFTQNYPFKKSQIFHKNRHVPALGATSIPRPCRGGERGGVSVIFHTCYWRDIRAFFILLTPVPVIVYLREGDNTDPTPAPPLQGRGTNAWWRGSPFSSTVLEDSLVVTISYHIYPLSSPHISLPILIISETTHSGFVSTWLLSNLTTLIPCMSRYEVRIVSCVDLLSWEEPSISMHSLSSGQ